MRPYKCPICNGRGTVPSDFYYTPVTVSTTTGITTDGIDMFTTDTWTYTPEVECRSCKGTGVLWSYDYNLQPYYPNPFPQYPNDPWYVHNG